MAPTAPRSATATPRIGGLAVTPSPAATSAAQSPAGSPYTPVQDVETAIWHVHAARGVGPAGPARVALQLPLPAAAGSVRKPARRMHLVAGGVCVTMTVLLVITYVVVSSISRHGGKALPVAQTIVPAPGGPGAVPSLPPDAAANASVPSNESSCYDFHASLGVHPLQVYTGNPDSSVRGYAQVLLCTNGTMLSSSIFFDGRTQIVASHIHLAASAHGREANAIVAEGPPVINFCGNNNLGVANDGTPYSLACNQWDSQWTASNLDVPGVLVSATNAQANVTAAERIADIVARPQAYYFSFDTLASLTHWAPKHPGACRGPLEFAGSV